MMKAVLLTAVLLMSSTLCGQSYIPFIDTSATWQDEDAYWDMGPDVGSYRCYRYYFGGDTLLNDTVFRVFLSDGHGGFAGPLGASGLNYHSGDTVGFMHEDTAARRVYFRHPGWSYARLFYDFSAGVGPYPYTYRYGMNIEVEAIDTLVLADGPHRRMILSSGDHVVEGIGSLTDVMDVGWGWGVNWINQLSCHTANGVPNYEVFSDDCACGTNVGIVEKQETRIRVGPSPTDGFCRLEGAQDNAQVQVLGLDGRVKSRGQCSPNGSAVLDLSLLSSGIYLVVVTDGATTLTTRVVKE